MATKKILIVIDVQNDFITGALANKEAIKALPNLVNLVNTEKFDETYVTMDTHGENYKETLEGKKLPVPHCIRGTEGWIMPEDFHDVLIKRQNVKQIFEKPTFGSRTLVDAFTNQLWHDEKAFEGAEFTFVGFCTDICVVSNALMLRAAFPNNVIKVRKDCVAGVTKESNKAALLTMKMCQIEVI